MELDDAIKGRRSIREYADRPVPAEFVRKVLEAGTLAPSSRNQQPWRFTVLTGDAKKKLATSFRSELEKLSARIGTNQMGSSFESCRIMEEAPVLIMVWNSHELRTLPSLQSVAAAVQNMLLEAYNLGLGSLWICDVYFASGALAILLGKPWELVAAVTLGWPAFSPHTPPRRTVDEVSEFLT